MCCEIRNRGFCTIDNPIFCQNLVVLTEITYFLNRYDIVYKQAVTSEDMFLRMSNKTPATASCENMVVSMCQSVNNLHEKGAKCSE